MWKDSAGTKDQLVIRIFSMHPQDEAGVCGCGPVGTWAIKIYSIYSYYSYSYSYYDYDYDLRKTKYRVQRLSAAATISILTS